MHARDNMSDEIPVADAVEQDQETAPEPPPPREYNPPMEANRPDRQEQLQEVVDDDREEYRDWRQGGVWGRPRTTTRGFR